MIEKEHVARAGSFGDRVRSAWAWLERHAAARHAAVSLFLVALAVYALESIAWPLAAGRDLGDYLLNYVQIFWGHVVLPGPMVGRTPVTPLVAGGLLDANGWLAEAVLGCLFASSVVAWFVAARRFGVRAAIFTAVALLVYPGYGALFHELSSDAIFAAVFAGVSLLVLQAVDRPSPGRFAVLGLGLAGLSLVRPSAQVLVLLALVPLVLAGSWRQRVARATALVAALALPLLAWAGYNDVRFDDFAVQRGGQASVPFFRTYVVDHIVEPGNGPASRRLAAAVERDLLPKEPYRSYGITLEQFFKSGSIRTNADLIALSDRVWGWDSDHSELLKVGLEAVRRHPWTYLRGVTRTVKDELWLPLYVIRQGPSASPTTTDETIVVRGRRLPRPSEDEPIPAARMSPRLDTPDQRIREVWTSATEHHAVFRDPEDAVLYAKLNRDVGRLFASFPRRGRSKELGRRLNQASRWYPRPALWLLLGLLAAAVRHPRRIGSALVVAASAFLLLVFTALGVYAVAEYAAPVAPAFVLLAAVGLLGPAGTRRAEPTDHLASGG